MAPGILYVTMQPKPELPPEPFHDWYNNEHGPLRLRLPFCRNGFRYRAADLEGPGNAGQHEWMAVYDLDDVEELNGEEYMKLRCPPVQSQREIDIRPHVDINRRTYDLLSDRKHDDYQPVERPGGEEAGNVMVYVAFTVKPDQDPKELARWYEEEHTGMLQRVPGWRRTRRFKTSSSVDKALATEYLALHEYAVENGLGGPEFVAATTTPWARKVNEQVIASKERRVWKHHYTFGPAPRHLSSSMTEWSNPATLTRTVPGEQPVLESYITTRDGARIPYHLTGKAEADDDDPSAPLLLCLNPILTHHAVWSRFTTAFLARNPHHRVLRFDARGRSSLHLGKDDGGGGGTEGTVPTITLDTLAGDVIDLLDALRVRSVAAAVGVSLGGATAMYLGLHRPDRVPRWLACDTNAKAPAGNPAAWAGRIAVAEADPTGSRTGAVGAQQQGEGEEEEGDGRVVGRDLAEATVRRWFVKESFDGAEMETRVDEVREMVRRNGLEGFKRGVRALYEYDMTGELGACKSKGELLVGAGDGALPEGMRKLAEALGDGKGGKGVRLTVVQGAGHLPMVERPEEVVEAVERLLR